MLKADIRSDCQKKLCCLAQRCEFYIELNDTRVEKGMLGSLSTEAEYAWNRLKFEAKTAFSGLQSLPRLPN